MTHPHDSNLAGHHKDCATLTSLAGAMGDLQRWAQKYKFEPEAGSDFRGGAVVEPGASTINVNLSGFAEALTVLNRKADKLMALIDDLTQDVADERTVIDSAVALLDNLSAQITAAGTDPAKLAALKSSIDANKQALADAVVKNTPAENAPPAP